MNKMGDSGSGVIVELTRQEWVYLQGVISAAKGEQENHGIFGNPEKKTEVLIKEPLHAIRAWTLMRFRINDIEAILRSLKIEIGEMPAEVVLPTPVVLVDGLPRRKQINLLTPAEKAIRDAMLIVEGMPDCDPLLTEATMLLGNAWDKVADYVELPKEK